MSPFLSYTNISTVMTCFRMGVTSICLLYRLFAPPPAAFTRCFRSKGSASTAPATSSAAPVSTGKRSSSKKVRGLTKYLPRPSFSVEHIFAQTYRRLPLSCLFRLQTPRDLSANDDGDAVVSALAPKKGSKTSYAAIAAKGAGAHPVEDVQPKAATHAAALANSASSKPAAAKAAPKTVNKPAASPAAGAKSTGGAAAIAAPTAGSGADAKSPKKQQKKKAAGDAGVGSGASSARAAGGQGRRGAGAGAGAGSASSFGSDGEADLAVDEAIARALAEDGSEDEGRWHVAARRRGRRADGESGAGAGAGSA